MLSNLGNIVAVAAVVGAIGAIFGYFFALSQAGQGRRNMLLNAGALSGILAIICVGFTVSLALSAPVKLVAAGLWIWTGLAIFVPALVIAFNGHAQNVVVKKAEDSAREVLFCFNEISGGADQIKSGDLRAALRTKGIFTRSEKRAIEHLLANMNMAGHLVGSKGSNVLMPLPMSKVQLLPVHKRTEVYCITRADLAGYAARCRAAW